MVLNKLNFALMAGVGRAAITLAVQRGVLDENSMGFIDTEDPQTKAYLEKRKNKPSKQKNMPEPKQKREPKPKPEPKSRPEPRPEPAKSKTKLDSLDGVDLPLERMDFGDEQDEVVDELAKLAADIRLKKAQAQRHELQYEKDKGLLISVEAVERAAAKVGAEIKIRLQDLPRRIAPRLQATAKSGGDVQEILEREIDDAIESIRTTLGVKIE